MQRSVLEGVQGPLPSRCHVLAMQEPASGRKEAISVSNIMAKVPDRTHKLFCSYPFPGIVLLLFSAAGEAALNERTQPRALELKP